MLAQTVTLDRGAAALGSTLAGVGTTGRVLTVAAHPDDEDTPIIAWLAKGRHVETAYLSLTRGDGGQNLIGNELGEALGARPETFLGLGGVGDLMATAHGSWSRNRSLGEQLAKDPQGTLAALAARKEAVEGHRAAGKTLVYPHPRAQSTAPGQAGSAAIAERAG